MSHHPEIQAAIDSAPSPLEPWGMMHILAVCNRIAKERDELKAFVDAAFKVHPNLDLDISNSPFAANGEAK